MIEQLRHLPLPPSVPPDRGPPPPPSAELIIRFAPMAAGLVSVSDGRVLTLAADIIADPYTLGAALIHEVCRLIG